MSICEKVALVTVNNCVKFYENSLNFVIAMEETSNICKIAIYRKVTTPLAAVFLTKPNSLKKYGR